MTRKMLKFNPELSEQLGKRILECGFTPDIRKMFGHEVFFMNGYMFCGANVEGAFFNVGGKLREEFLSTEKHVAPFTPVEGMAMKDYIQVDMSVCADAKNFKKWITTSGNYLLSLPPKRKKPKKKRPSPAGPPR